MPTPLITLPIHTMEQARALAGLLRAYIDGQSPDTNDGADWKPDPDLAGIAALYAHLNAGIEAHAAGRRVVTFRDGESITATLIAADDVRAYYAVQGGGEGFMPVAEWYAFPVI